uniref:hypothetical protein n=1 Tax=Acidocella sp. C78 TaxID=1671486 RepID=UPI0020BF5943|nr:hypothetical protein [Acidocella sp. C78]
MADDVLGIGHRYRLVVAAVSDEAGEGGEHRLDPAPRVDPQRAEQERNFSRVGMALDGAGEGIGSVGAERVGAAGAERRGTVKQRDEGGLLAVIRQADEGTKQEGVPGLEGASAPRRSAIARAWRGSPPGRGRAGRARSARPAG